MKRVMYREAIAAALAEEMRRDETVFVMGEDVAIVGGVYKATKGLLEEFGPQRVRNTPLSELAIMGTATGAAMCGARPVAEIMHIDFIGCGFDILLNQMSKMRYKTNGQVTVPLVIRTQCGRGKSNGCTQSQSLEALFTDISGLNVVMPATPKDAKGLLKSAIRDNNPVVFIEHKGLYQTKGEVPEEEYLIPLGQADVKHEGSDVTIISWSKTVLTALDAAKELEAKGIIPDVVVVDPPRKGLNADTIEALSKMAPRRIVYVSCDPATLARDVKLLAERGYHLQKAEAADLFPRTHHVETVCLLTRESEE